MITPMIIGFILLVVLGIFIRFCFRRYSLIKKGKPINIDNISRRIGYVLSTVLLQKCVLKSVSSKDRAGIGHLLIFWGFIICSFSYLVLFSQAVHITIFDSLTETRFYGHFLTLVECISFLTLVAIIWAFCRRYIVQPDRLETTFDSFIVLSLILCIISSYFLQQSFSIVTGKSIHTSSLWISLVGARIIEGIGLQAGMKQLYLNLFWWMHILTITGFLAYIPSSKHMHIISSPFNIFFRSWSPRGELQAVDLSGDHENYFGVGEMDQFSRKQLLDLFSCAECGRCQDNCPAYLSGKELSPKKVIRDLKNYLLKVGSDGGSLTVGQEKPKNVAGSAVSEAAIWDCTTCYSCQDQCPTEIGFVDKIVDLRRFLVLSRSEFPQELDTVFRNLEVYGDPYGIGSAYRYDWAESLSLETNPDEADYLFWVGCGGAFDDRVKELAISMASILTNLGINFTILGREEKCCGDSARRLGNEYLFQTLAETNIEKIKQINTKNIITFCPHCYNIFKNEYPKFGGDFEVFHASQFLLDLLKQGSLKIDPILDYPFTYHDPCYLGRYNGIYGPPRELLDAMSPDDSWKKEMTHNRESSFCCGGGGGRFWMEESVGRKISQMRVEEAISSSVGTIVTACPFCMVMLEDAVRALDLVSEIKVIDITELVCDAG